MTGHRETSEPTRAPRVSVVIPAFDRADVIRRTLESLARQSYENVEVIVVDDGSTDDTRAIVEGFAKESRRPVTYFRQENRGCAAARNQGLRLATGELFAFLDSDDEWLPAAAEALANALLASDADFVYSPAIESYPDGTERVNYPVGAGRPESFAVEHFSYTNVRNGAFMFRRHVLSEVHGLDERLRHNEDSDFIQRLAVRYRAAYCPTPTVKVYHHGGNKSLDRVGIYTALIRSAERVLDESPAFRSELGAAAGLRMRELRTKHVEALLLAGAFDEAQRVSAAAQADVERLARLAARMRTTMPLKARNRVRRWKRFAKRRLRYGLKRPPTGSDSKAYTSR
jgi:glycosyltransferase involved in cell wall biosynthesis